jgi:ABC-type transport system involved in multi-copper enzyme maturation permease subunit
MSTTLIQKIFGPLNLVGPIFGKELRTASRRRRNYLLRSIYVLILSIFVGMIWYSSAGSYYSGSASVYTVWRMSRVGVELLITIGVFQFIALQIISPVLTSTAISDEINHSTLGVLMMTPITSLQIVMGKLLSKMLMVILLICASLPLLAIIRIFGGIDWRYVVEFISLTICASLFAASISLLFSIFHKKAYAAIIMTYVTLLALYLLIPLFLTYEAGTFNQRPDRFMYFNPFVALGFIVNQIENPTSTTVIGAMWWTKTQVQCVLLLGATFLMVLFSAIFVRRVALRMTAGEKVIQFKPKKKKRIDVSSLPTSEETESSIVFKQKTSRSVTDSPVLWRELHIPLMGTRGKRLIVFIFAGVVGAWTYWRCWNMRDDFEMHIAYTIIFMLLSFIAAAILSATTITSEKEASTWQTLFTTPMTSREIISGKIAGVANRLLVLILLYLGHIYYFVATEKINSLALVLLTPIFIGSMIFLIGTGTLISTKVKHTTTAVILNIGVGLFIWAIIPFLLLIVGELMHRGDNLAEASMAMHPVYLNGECINITAKLGAPDMPWPSFTFNHILKHETLHYLGAIFHFMMVGGIYTLIGIFCMEWAIRLLKRREV